MQTLCQSSSAPISPPSFPYTQTILRDNLPIHVIAACRTDIMLHLHDTQEKQTEATTAPSISLLGGPVSAATTAMSISGSSQMSHTGTGENER
ncbi:hypothetical protein AAC387_Pa01g0691 [Persea americana]